jgi:hypothetical protein
MKNGKTRRIPVPQKPPKVEEGKKTYNRRKEKKEAQKALEELKKTKTS